MLEPPVMLRRKHRHRSSLLWVALAPVLLAGCVTAPAPQLAAIRRLAPVPLESWVYLERLPEVGRTLRAMSLEQKIGERFVVWIKGTELSETSRTLIQEGSPAGVILYPWNVESREQVIALTAALQRAALRRSPPLGLFIGVDQEGGRVAALRLGELTRLPAAHYWGERRDPGYVLSAAYITARELRELGCNMNFAPVLDLYGQADHTIIGDRSMGDDPLLVGELGQAYLRGARLGGVIPVIKHFPGHGSTTVDSHGSLPRVALPEALLEERDFLPFRLAVEAGAEAVMTAHVVFSSIDPRYPVTLSRTFLEELLRRRWGFRGVVISDGMAMGAIARNFSVRESLRLQLEAGVDLILVHSTYELAQLKEEVLALLREGRLSEKQIDAGARRVLKLKLRYGLLPPFAGLE
jgi:beta-N-acetylhexosaminidase